MNLNKNLEIVPGAPDNRHSPGVPPLARVHTTLALLPSRALSSSLARSLSRAGGCRVAQRLKLHGALDFSISRSRSLAF